VATATTSAISINSGETTADTALLSAQTIFVYDNYPGGIGFSAPLYEVHGELLDGTRRLIASVRARTDAPAASVPLETPVPSRRLQRFASST